MKIVNENNSILKKISYSVMANIVSLLVSLLVVFIVPKMLSQDIESYGYYQIFLFYVGYIGFLHFGLCDGILLREAGKVYQKLDAGMYSGEFRMLIVFELIVAAIIALLGLILPNDNRYKFIWVFIAINIFLVIPKYMLSYILQATGRVREYSILTASGRGIFGIFILLNAITCLSGFKWLIVAQTIGELFSLLISIWYCKDLVLKQPYSYMDSFLECKKNVKIGYKLLVANISGLLMTGIVRFGIQTEFDVIEYGKVSFTLTVSNLLLTFINAIELVLFPSFRQTDENRLNGIYFKIYIFMMPLLFGSMLIYYPMELVLSRWLPEYSNSINYMAVLFPICIYSSKMNLLVQNYMKVYRLEKEIMYVNVAAMILSVITSVISVGIMHNILAAMAAIVMNHMIRCIYAEILLGKKIQVSVKWNAITEGLLSGVFIYSMWFVKGLKGMEIYVISYIIWMCCSMIRLKRYRID